MATTTSSLLPASTVDSSIPISISSISPLTNLEKCSLFGKLPLELRLKIWRDSFQPRQVCLDILYGENKTGFTFRDGKKHDLEENYHYPITLRVNRESRAETLRHYSFFFQTDAILLREEDQYKNRRLRKKPLCINPSIDLAAGMADNILIASVQYPRWLSHINSNTRGSLNVLKELKILGVEWNAETKAIMERGDHVDGNIFMFTGLEKLTLTVRFSPYGFGSLCKEKSQQHCFDCVKAFLALYAKKFRSGKAPKLAIEDVEGEVLFSEEG